MRRLNAIVVLFCLAVYAAGQTPTDFTGRWRQQTKAGAQRVLEVEQQGKSLRVRTEISNSEGTRDLEVRYEIGGPPATYKGLDGDEFRSSLQWEGSELVFDTVEREDGSEIPQKAVWTL